MSPFRRLVLLAAAAALLPPTGHALPPTPAAPPGAAPPGPGDPAATPALPATEEPFPGGERPRRPRREPVPLQPPGRPRLAPAPSDYVLVRYAPEVPLAERAQRAVAAGGGGFLPATAGRFGRVPVPAGGDATALLARLAADPLVAWAELDGRVWAMGPTATPAPATIGDPLFPRQWMYDRLDLRRAFDRNPTLGEGVVVAVVDTGVAYGSGGSYPRRRGLDLEGTTFVAGWDFVDDDPDPYDEGSAQDPDRPFTSPRFGHGTFAASLVAARVDNGVGGTGVAPRAALMPLRVLGVDGSGLFSDVADAIVFAADHGARVVNLSLGAADGSSAVAEAIEYADDRGVVLVAAAGNEAEEPDFDGNVAYPARYPKVVAVGATDYSGARADYSNVGVDLDVTAPAGDGLEEVAPGILDAALSTSFVYDPQTGEERYGGYWATGTSFATPQVAGLAALLVALGVEDPAAVRLTLEATARDLGVTGFDTDFGHGQADAFAAHGGVGFSQ